MKMDRWLGLKVTLPYTDGSMKRAGRETKVEVIDRQTLEVLGSLSANDLRILTPLDGVVTAQVRVPYVQIVLAEEPLT